MVERVKNNQEKKRTIASFNLNIPITYSISGEKSLMTEFEKYHEGKKNTFFKNNLLKIFDAYYDKDLLNNKEIRKAVKHLSNTILDEAGIDSSEHSQLHTEKMREYINNKKNPEEKENEKET